MNMKTFVIEHRLNYQEHYCDDAYVNKYYEIVRTNTSVGCNTIPDACVDLQFVSMEGKIKAYVCGSFLQCASSPSGASVWLFGVKFNPGKYPEMVRDDMENLIEGRREMLDYPWLTAMAEKISNAGSFEQRIRIFEETFPYDTQFSPLNPMIETAMRRIEEAHGFISIADIADGLQYNQHYIDRIFHKATGLSMKKYATIIRIQTAIRYLQEGREDEVYEKLGYYDQSYFIKKFKEYTSMTPREYCKAIERSIV